MGFIKRKIGVIAGVVMILVLLTAKAVLDMNETVVVCDEPQTVEKASMEAVEDIGGEANVTQDLQVLENTGVEPTAEAIAEAEYTAEPEETAESKYAAEPKTTSEPKPIPKPEGPSEPTPEESPTPDETLKPTERPASSERPSAEPEPSTEKAEPDEHSCALGHVFVKSVWETATCLKSGYYNNVCERCGLVEMVTESPLPHDVEEIVIEEGNCMEDKVTRLICRSCGLQIGADVRYTVAKHEWEKEEVDGAEVSVCKWCGVVK